jgi:hypothetical protein
MSEKDVLGSHLCQAAAGLVRDWAQDTFLANVFRRINSLPVFPTNEERKPSPVLTGRLGKAGLTLAPTATD